MFLGAGRAEKELGNTDKALEYFLIGMITTAGDGIEANRAGDCAREAANILMQLAVREDDPDKKLDLFEQAGAMLTVLHSEGLVAGGAVGDYYHRAGELYLHNRSDRSTAYEYARRCSARARSA